MARIPQFGVMYHLTGSSPEVWKADFDALAEGGFQRLVLWEVHNSLPAITAALDLCAERSLAAYCLPFQPIQFARDLSAQPNAYPEYKCVGIDGETLDFYNPFHRGFREQVLLPYLDAVVRHIGPHKALGGYF